MKHSTQRNIRAFGMLLIICGIILATYGFSTLNSLEFGPAGYLCPAHTCGLDEILQAGYGGYLETSYGGLALFVTGIAILAGSIAMGRGRPY